MAEVNGIKPTSRLIDMGFQIIRSRFEFRFMLIPIIIYLCFGSLNSLVSTMVVVDHENSRLYLRFSYI